MTADLLALLERQRPDLSPAERLALIADTPDARATEKPAQRRVGSRPRSSASMERRRSWAASGRMPPRLAARFTLAEQAVLAVVAVKVAEHGTCGLTIGHIAALAGVSETTVRNAIREARALGLVTVEERRKSAWVSFPNLVRIVSPEWASWLRLHGCKSVKPTDSRYKNLSESRSAKNAAKGFRRTEGEAGTPVRTNNPGRPQWI
jgi:DNA-binding transcriptional ArsR family regulator